MIILHGLLGSSSNWRRIARELADNCRVITIDLPNHGLSPYIPDADLQLTCDCIVDTMRSTGLEHAVILGHSMGGKIAMQLSSNNPEIVQDGLIVADMLPKAVPPAHLFILRACEQLNLTSATHRKELDQMLARAVPQFETRAFILKNVKRDQNNRFYWQVNLANIIANYRMVSDAPNLHLPYNGKTLFIGGALSPYKIASEETLIHTWFPHAEIKTIANAGHLLHADQPREFSTLVRNFVTYK